MTLAYTIKEFCREAKVGRTTAYKLLDSGQLVRKKIGSATRIPAWSAHKFFDVPNSDTGAGK